MIGNMDVERVFATFGALSREHILEIVPSGAMFDHMEAMLVRKCYSTIPGPYLSLSPPFLELIFPYLCS